MARTCSRAGPTTSFSAAPPEKASTSRGSSATASLSSRRNSVALTSCARRTSPPRAPCPRFTSSISSGRTGSGLPELDDLIGLDVLEAARGARGPAHLDERHNVGLAQPPVRTDVALRQIRLSRPHLADELPAVGMVQRD